MAGEDAALSMSNDTRHGDASEYVNIKDGLLMAPSAGLSTDSVTLAIKCPSLTDGPSESTILTVPSRYSIGQVKKRIEASWIGKPRSQGMRMFKAGQLLDDDVILGDLIAKKDRSEPAAIHLVIRSNAWTESRPSVSQQRTSSATMTSPRPSSTLHRPCVATNQYKISSPLPSAGLDSPLHFPLPSIDQPPVMPRTERTLANVIESMDPSNYGSFRSLLTWSYYRYVEMYEKRWKEMYGDSSEEAKVANDAAKSIQRLAIAMSCSEEEVIAAVDLVEKEALQWGSIEDEIAASKAKVETSKIYKSVTLQGLPYLLQLNRDARSGPLNIILGRIKRLQDIIHRMDKLISYQTLFEQASNTSLLQANMRSRQGAALAAATAAAPGGALNPNERQYRIRLVFNLTDFFNIALPAFFLSLKVTLLVYMFTRGASKYKTCLIALAGALFVVVEAWRSAQRHNQNRQRVVAREADRQERANRPANDASRPEASSEEQAGPSIDPIESLRPHAPTRHRATSPLAIEYWIERLAYVGLAAEDQEMHWHVRDSTLQDQSPMMKMILKYAILPVLLMIITLVPEIEQKRRKAIDEREDIIKSTAKKVEDRKARLREEKEKDESDGIAENATTTAEEDIPTFLQHPYCQRIIHYRRSGRQIDIAQELEAAAAAGDGQPADMGFI